MAKITPQNVLVVGATGNTGKYIVKMLLDSESPQHQVTVIVRSKTKMLKILQYLSTSNHDIMDKKDNVLMKCPTNLTIVEVSDFLNEKELSNEKLQSLLKDCTAVVSCLGHTMDMKGLWGYPKSLVTDTVKRLTTNMPSTAKFILMNSDGVSHPDGISDPLRSYTERTIIFLLRYLINPHYDNEQAAKYLYDNRDGGNGGCKIKNFVVVRPTDLIDSDETSEYTIYMKQHGSLFGSGVVSRINVATFMVNELILDVNGNYQTKYNQQFPIIYNKENESENEES